MNLTCAIRSMTRNISIIFHIFFFFLLPVFPTFSISRRTQYTYVPTVHTPSLPLDRAREVRENAEIKRSRDDGRPRKTLDRTLSLRYDSCCDFIFTKQCDDEPIRISVSFSPFVELTNITDDVQRHRTLAEAFPRLIHVLRVCVHVYVANEPRGCNNIIIIIISVLFFFILSFVPF